MPHVTERAILYSIPKTGSTWCRMALGGKRAGAKDYTIGEKRHFVLNGLHGPPRTLSHEEREGRFEFAFVRRPEDWLRSLWCDQVLAKLPLPADGLPMDAFPPIHLMSDKFELFVRNVVRLAPGYVTRIFQQYVGPKGDALDFVGRQENLEADFVKALTLAGEPVPNLPDRPANVTPPEMIAKAKLSAATRTRVLETESWILETFYARNTAS